MNGKSIKKNNETGKRIKRNIGTMTHGGRREGAGRKPKGEQPKTATIAIRTTEQTKQLIKDEAQKRGVSISQMVEDLIIEKAGI
jgi:hypothetical protein